MSTARLVQQPLRITSNALTKSKSSLVSSSASPNRSVMTPANKIGRMRISVPPHPTHHLRTCLPSLASLPGRQTFVGDGRNVSSSARRWQGSSTTVDTTTNPDADVNAGTGAGASAGASVENTSSPPPPSKPAEKASGAKNGKTNGKEEKTELAKLKEEKEDVVGRLRYLQADLLNVQRIAALEKEKTRDFAIAKFAGDLLQVVDTLEMALKSAAVVAAGAPSPAASLTLGDSTTSSGTSTETSSSGTSSSTSSSSSEDEAKSTPGGHSTSPSPSSPSSSSSPSLSDTDPSTPSTTPSTTTTTKPDTALLQGITLTHRLLLSTLATHGITPFTPTRETFDPNWHEALFEVPLAVVAAAARGGEVKDGEEEEVVRPGMIVDTFKVGYRIKDRCLRAAQVGVVGE